MSTILSFRQVTVVNLILAGAIADRALGQGPGHGDLAFAYENGRIVSHSGNVIGSSFPTSGISKQFTSNPGFASETDAGGGIGPGEQVIYTIVDDLQFWDGAQFRTPREDVQIRIQHSPPTIPDTIANGISGVLAGSFEPYRNRIGQANGGGDFHAHVNFFLEPESPDGLRRPDYGVYGLKLQIQSSSDTVLASDPLFFAFNFGLGNDEFAIALERFSALLLNDAAPGDFNNDGKLEVVDLDALTLAALTVMPEPKFDLNGDSRVDQQDREHWVVKIKQSYIGDSNLDGQFSSGDLVQVLQRGEYEDGVEANSLWSDGDWNGDLEFDTSDLVYALQSGGYEQGRREQTAAVPEPQPQTRVITSAVILAIGLFRRHGGHCERIKA